MLHSSRITGYTFQAENYCPEHMIETLITQGMASPGARGMEPEEVLFQLQFSEGVDYEDETSYDSGVFPKAIWDGMPDRGNCGTCNEDL